MICSSCNQPIAEGERTAHGPDGVSHYTCFKRGTAVGEELDVFSLHEEIGRLKKRVQDLESANKSVLDRLTADERHIDFRIE